MIRTLSLSVAAACLVSLAPAVHAAQAPASAPSVERRTQGSLTIENAPVVPPEVRETLRRYQNARSAAFADWLDDGSMLIATRFGQVNQLHRVTEPGGARTQITFFDEPVNGATAVSGSNRFVFAKDTGGDEYFQAYLADVAGGPEVRITEPGTRNQSIVFSPDGRWVAWSRVTPGDGNYDVVMAEVGRPESRRVVLEGTGAVAPLDVSADGKTILLGRSISQTKSERMLLDVATGATRPLIAELHGKDVAFEGGEFAGDGLVYLLSDLGGEFMRLVRVDARTGGVTPMTPETLRWDVEAFDLSDDGRRLAWSVNEDGVSRVTVARVDARGNAPRVTPRPALPNGIVSGLGFSPDGARLAFSLSTPTSAGDVWVLDSETGGLTRWTYSELGGLNPEQLVDARLVRFRSFDGLSVPAFVYGPKTPGAERPVIIDIHGGPEGQSRPGFNPRIQYWVAELGATVIVPNVRGSTGYGRTYTLLDNAEKREDSVKDIGALLDWIATQPDLDASRVAVYGGSYGGYMVLASMTHFNDRLAGGVNIVGISDFRTFLRNTEGYRRDLRRVEYGDERDPRMAEVFARISPMANIDKVTRPMLVIHGKNDPRVPVSEAHQIVERLRARGNEVWYVEANDEGHGFRKKPNVDAQREIETLYFRRVFGAR